MYIPSNSKFLTHYLPGKTYSILGSLNPIICLESLSTHTLDTPSPSKHSPAISCASLWESSPQKTPESRRPCGHEAVPFQPRLVPETEVVLHVPSFARRPLVAGLPTLIQPGPVATQGAATELPAEVQGNTGEERFKKKGGTGRCSKKF